MPRTFPPPAYGKAALEKILALPLLLVPLVSRTERKVYATKFTALRDATDLPHAIAAAVYGCDTIVAYDEHFEPSLIFFPTRPQQIFFDLFLHSVFSPGEGVDYRTFACWDVT